MVKKIGSSKDVDAIAHILVEFARINLVALEMMLEEEGNSQNIDIQIVKEIQRQGKRYKRAFHHLTARENDPEKRVAHALHEIGQTCSSLKKHLLTSAIDAIQKQMHPFQLLGFTEDIMQHFYDEGYRLHEQGKTEAASDIFCLLTALNPLSKNVWYAWGMSLASQGLYQEALIPFLRLTAIDPDSPGPDYWCSLCLQKSGVFNEGNAFLSLALTKCQTHPDGKQWESLCNSIQQQL